MTRIHTYGQPPLDTYRGELRHPLLTALLAPGALVGGLRQIARIVVVDAKLRRQPFHVLTSLPKAGGDVGVGGLCLKGGRCGMVVLG